LNDGSGDRARAVVIILAVAGALAAGCGNKNPYAAGSFQRAACYAEHEDYQLAADAFGVFVRQNPADSLAAEGQYRKALAYLELHEYPLAVVELQILQKDYPNSPLVEEAMFREGEAYLAQVGRLERDVSGAYSAREHFLKFVRRYPNYAQMSAVRARLTEISDLLVRKRLQAAHVYEQLGRWEAVALTLDHVIDEEPDSALLDQVLLRRAEVAQRLFDLSTARTMYDRLLTAYPNSDLAGRARTGLAALGPAAAPAPVPAAGTGETP
jgi:outer membrane assembly lipoprotein YfiO